jgi:four helix bundle protein
MQPHASTGSGMRDDRWTRDVHQMMHKVRYLAGVLRSRNLGLLTDQLEQTGYRIVAGRSAADDRDHGAAGVHFIQIARSCIREIDYQLLLAREAGLPGRGAYEPLQQEFGEIRRILAACIRKVRSNRGEV